MRGVEGTIANELAGFGGQGAGTAFQMVDRRSVGHRCLRAKMFGNGTISRTASFPRSVKAKGSFAMIGMAGENLLAAIDLLEQHAAHKKMRPCHGPERYCEFGLVEHGIAEPVGAAYHESKACV